jgi:hypothetical protein
MISPSSWRGPDERFRRAAVIYFVYGVVYWVVALYLQMRVFTVAPRLLIWFVIGAAIAVGVPWLLWRPRAWFERWVLSRRDFARIVAVLVSARVVTICWLAWQGPEALRMPRFGGGIPPTRTAALLMALVAAVAAVALARAAWHAPEPEPTGVARAHSLR